MERCKTCKHWQYKGRSENPNAGDLCAPVDPDTFREMAMPFEVRVCKHPGQKFHERPAETNGFGLVDGSQYYAALVTAEDFGCVRHEPS